MGDLELQIEYFKRCKSKLPVKKLLQKASVLFFHHPGAAATNTHPNARKRHTQTKRMYLQHANTNT